MYITTTTTKATATTTNIESYYFWKLIQPKNMILIALYHVHRSHIVEPIIVF